MAVSAIHCIESGRLGWSLYMTGVVNFPLKKYGAISIPWRSDNFSSIMGEVKRVYHRHGFSKYLIRLSANKGLEKKKGSIIFVNFTVSKSWNLCV